MLHRFSALALSAYLTSTLLAQPPATRRQPVTDEYHGVRVVDDYRWLENGKSEEVHRWVAAQNAHTRSLLDPLPYREAIRRDILEQLRRRSVRYVALAPRREAFFMLKIDPAKQQPTLVVTPSLDDLAGERTVVDPNVLNAQGHLAIDWFEPSLDGRRVAVAMSEGGSEDASLYIFDVATGKRIGEVVPRVSYPTGGGSMAWLEDGRAFFYTRYPQGTERPAADRNFYQQVWLHHIGTPAASDTYVLGKDFPRIAETVLESDSAGKHFIASVANGDGGEFEHFLRLPDGGWKQITRFEDRIVSAAIGDDGAVYLLSRKDAPRGKVLRLPPGAHSISDARLIVPEGKASIEIPEQGSGGAAPVLTSTRLYVRTIDGGPNQIDIYDHFGKSLGAAPLKEPFSIRGIVALQRDAVAFSAEGYLTPPALSIFDGNTVRTTAVRVKPQMDLSGVEVERAFVKSADGTAVPMTIVHRKNLKRDGNTPALITGYGGFGISITPSYLESGNLPLWIQQGGIAVITNLRGGGEYGEQWHASGSLLHKQNVFDDFAACARYLVEHRYSSPARMAAIGGSNGGLLMGAVLTEHPSYFRAVVSMVGIYDMLRTELDPNGQFNVTEYGSVRNAAEFKALYAYSPYHHVDRGAAYPAVLMMTGDNDGRVNPAHSRKMVAALQSGTSSPNPILLRTSSNAGHGIGTPRNEQVEQGADAYAFLFRQLGIQYRPQFPASR